MRATKHHIDIDGSYGWRATFAWLPVKTIGGKTVWLSEVYKRRFWELSTIPEPTVEYATLVDLLNE